MIESQQTIANWGQRMFGNFFKAYLFQESSFMKISFLSLAIVSLLLSLGACTTSGVKEYNEMHAENQRKEAESNEWIKTLPDPNADYGQYPTKYVELIKQYFTKTLKDPESARYSNFSKPRKEHIANVRTKQATYGYSACVLVNAKNSYGGYTGNKQYWFFFRDNDIVRVQDTGTGFGEIIYRGRPVNCQDGSSR